MGFAIGGRAGLAARDAVTEREARRGGDALVVAVADERAGAADSLADGAGGATRAMTTEDHWSAGSRGGNSAGGSSDLAGSLTGGGRGGGGAGERVDDDRRGDCRGGRLSHRGILAES